MLPRQLHSIRGELKTEGRQPSETSYPEWEGGRLAAVATAMSQGGAKGQAGKATLVGGHQVSGVSPGSQTL